MNGHPEVVVLLSLLLTPFLPGEGVAQTATAEPDSVAPEHTVAVLSPSSGPLRDVGRLHDESAKRVFRLGDGNSTSIHGHTVRFLFRGTGNPVEDAATCVEEAQRLVESEQAVAILGPVSSGCSNRVLSLGLEVPVITSLSTARGMGDRDEWFFRTIADDQRRLETFVDTARGRGIPIERSVAVYEPSSYGEGLLKHLMALIPSVDSAHAYRWDEAFGEPGHDIQVMEAFRSALASHHAITTVFILASSDRMVGHVQALDAMFESFGDPENDPSFVLVGSTPNAEDLPHGTWIIAEAQVGTSPNLITQLRMQDPSPDLYISSLDAAIALKEALTDIFREAGSDPPDPGALRENLRHMLDQKRFPSADRYRSFEFVDGEISPTPEVPVYQVMVEERRTVESVNPDPRESWVEVSIRKRPGGHLEGPVVVDLIAHGEDLVGESVTLQVGGIGDEGGDPVEVEQVELTRGSAAVSFTPSFLGGRWFPGSFWIGTDRTPRQERVEVAGLGWPASYGVALLAALVGALLYARHRSRKARGAEAEGEDGEGASGVSRRRQAWTLAERCLSGLVIAFLIIHIAPLLEGEPVLSQIPIPQFGSSIWFNAFASGLLGGWLGLSPIMSLATAVVGTLTPLFHGEG